jgi:hypothetical protein
VALQKLTSLDVFSRQIFRRRELDETEVSPETIEHISPSTFTDTSD